MDSSDILFISIPIGIIVACLGAVLGIINLVIVGILISGIAMLIVVYFASKELGWFEDRIPITYPREKKFYIDNREIHYHEYRRPKKVYYYCNICQLKI